MLMIATLRPPPRACRQAKPADSFNTPQEVLPVAALTNLLSSGRGVEAHPGLGHKSQTRQGDGVVLRRGALDGLGARIGSMTPAIHLRVHIPVERRVF